jgi:hypothetical protein
MLFTGKNYLIFLYNYIDISSRVNLFPTCMDGSAFHKSIYAVKRNILISI